MSTTSCSGNLLEYNAKYHVLICRECKYAIQKDAVESHLLRHKIYRGEKRRLLSFVAQFELLQPDDVQNPPAGSPSVDGLPIISGYSCTSTGCGSLWASYKRMRRHWSESHGIREPPESCGRPVSLQTFFRGTKLKYFEVASIAERPDASLLANDGPTREQLHSLNDTGTNTSHESSSMPSPPATLFTPDLDTLRYFHHFTNTTSPTLPARNSQYWQKSVVEQALRQHWLMSGLLAISASHLAALSEDEWTRRAHQERSSRFIQGFSAGWGELKRGSDVTDAEEVTIGTQIASIYHCCCRTESESPIIREELFSRAKFFRLPSYMIAIQDCGGPETSLLSALGTNVTEMETSVQVRNNLGDNTNTTYPLGAPPALLECLHSLPFRMPGLVGRPENAVDVLSALSAADSLVECCTMSYASNDMRAAWKGMEEWLRRCSNQFKTMVVRQSPGPLIVVAYWSLLVQRAELYYWFLKGLASRILQLVEEELPRDSAIQSLVEHLTSLG